MKYFQPHQQHSGRQSDKPASNYFVFDDEPIESLLGHDQTVAPTPANALELWDRGERNVELANDLIAQMLKKFERVEIPGHLDELIVCLEERIKTRYQASETWHELACAQYLLGRLHHRRHAQLDLAKRWYRLSSLTLRKPSLDPYLTEATAAVKHELGIQRSPETDSEDYHYWTKMLQRPEKLEAHISHERCRLKYALKQEQEDIAKGETPHPHSSLVRNELALALCHNRELQESENLLRRALANETLYLNPGHPKIPHRMNNLAGVLLIAGKLKPSAAINQLAWNKKQRWGHDRTSARILFIRIIVELLQKKPIARSLGQLKTLVASNELNPEGGVVSEWDFLPRLTMVREWLPDEEFDFLKTLLRTVNQVTRIPCLYQYPQWREAKPVSLRIN